jgi:hypothetical protein
MQLIKVAPIAGSRSGRALAPVSARFARCALCLPIALLFFGCQDRGRVHVRYDASSLGSALESLEVRVAVGEPQAGVFTTLVATGAPATIDPVEIELIAPGGENRRVRVLIHDKNFGAILHGQSAPFAVEDSVEPIMVDVPLGPPPEGSISRLRIVEGAARIGMRARRWDRVRIGLGPKQPFGEAVRQSNDPPSDMLESFTVDVPLQAEACPFETGCPLTFFVDFLAEDGVAGPTATATITFDAMPPSLTPKARIVGGLAVGSATQLLVDVEAGEPVAAVELTLARTVERSGECAASIGPAMCTGRSVRFTCTLDAPPGSCDGSYTINVSATDAAGNRSTVPGAEIAIDTIPPELAVGSIGCTSGAMVVSGNAVDARQVILRDAGGETIAWADPGPFVLAASSSIAASVAALDAGGNEISAPVSCP